MTRILSISSGRADFGVLSTVWKEIAASPDLSLTVLLTGMHMADGAAARANLPAGVAVKTGGADLAGASGRKCVDAMSAVAAAAAAAIEDADPDLVMVIGDRLDMFPAAAAAAPFRTPLAHIHGGELSFGAIDDSLRHAMSKLSHYHFVSSVSAAQRLCRMGEEPWRIHVCGAPGLDTLLAQPEISATDFVQELKLSALDGLRLVTVHPETNSDDPAAPLDAVLGALDRAPAPTLFTAVNSDPGAEPMRAAIADFVANRPWASFRATLGARLYANALRFAVVMIGNSSSGIIEAGLFGLPVVNVGARQDGRERSANVVDTPNDADAVARAVARIAGRFPGGSGPYGDGRAAGRIVDQLRRLPSRRRLLDKKFFDGSATFAASWAA